MDEALRKFQPGYAQRLEDEAALRHAAQLNALGEAFDRRDLSDLAVARGWPVQTLEAEIRKSLAPLALPPGDIEMTQREIATWSALRHAEAVLRNPHAMTFERECSQAIEQSLDRLGEVDHTKTFFVPRQVQARTITRDLTAGVNASGGFLAAGVAQIGFTPALTASSFLRRFGATFVGGPRGMGTIPRVSGTATAQWLTGEAVSPTESTPVLGAVNVAPKTVAAYCEIGRKLEVQAGVLAEQFAFADLGRQCAVAVDTAAIAGDGTSAPAGVLLVPGIGAFAGASIDYDDFVDAQGDLADANGIVNPAAVGWVTTPTVAKLLKKRYRVASTDSPIWQGPLHAGAVDGAPAIATTACADGAIVLADWSQVVVVEWGVLQLDINPYASFAAGVIGLRALWSVDIAFRQPASFTASTSVT